METPTPICPDWNPKFTNSFRALLPPTNNTKIIIPVLPYGPNNQLRGFRETIYLGHQLDRAIVPPPFFKHSRTDATSEGFRTGWK